MSEEIKTIFDPKKEITDEDWRGMKQKLEELRGRPWRDFLSMVMAMKIIFPEKFAEISISEKEWKEMREELENYRGKVWLFFVSQVMAMKIVMPEKFKPRSEISLLWGKEVSISLEDWQGIKGELENYRNKGLWLDFSTLAMGMKILASPEVKISDKGLELKGRD